MSKSIDLNRFKELKQEGAIRERELLKVYRPVTKDQDAFHRCTTHEIVCRGGKRSGKSTSTVAEFARRVLGAPLYDAHDRLIPTPWPVSTPNAPLIYWVIGYAVDHIGQTIHRLLFEPGQFYVIPDEVTGKWRTFNPADPADAARQSESRGTEPAIPSRFIKKISWENKVARQFSEVQLTNGAVIRAYPSSAVNPKMGDPVSGLWIDEDIRFPEHLKEWQDRLTDRSGWFLWSAFPKRSNHALKALLDRIDEEEYEQPEFRTISGFQFVMTDNPMISERDKHNSLARMGSEDEIQRRNRGELLMDELQMYDHSPEVHNIRRLTGAS